MSGIFGIFNRDGKSVDKEIVNTMLDAMSYWEPDERNLWRESSVAFGHAMLWNTPESKYEHLPLHKETYVLTMDARIDNRDELMEKLELPNRPLEEIGDSEFIVAAYKKWGEECPKFLLGDFAFAIWDEEKQHLFCARDPFGIKLFHYYQDDSIFIFSSDILGVLSHTSVLKDYDEKTLSLFLRDQGGVHTPKDTFFDKIKKLPGATTLIITAEEMREQTYWRIEESPSVHYETHQEYVDALRTLLESAVEVRLRTTYPVVSHLSGGIDSSSIAVLTARRLKERKQSLHAYNWIDIPEDSEAYETEAYEFSRRIAKLEQIKHYEFVIDSVYRAQWWDTHDFTTQGNMFYLGEYYIQNEAKQIGARTILSGWGGDELISYNGYTYMSGLFKQRKYIRALKAVYEEKKLRGYSWFRFIKRCVSQMDIPLIREYLKQRDEQTIDLYDTNDYMYIKKEFKEVMEGKPFEELPDVHGIRNRQLAFVYYGHLQNRIESWALSAFSKKIEYRYPLLDRRIAEFAYGVPEDLFFAKNGHYRYLMRSAISDLLPYDIAWFPKPDEIKVDRTHKKQYESALEIWHHKHKNDNTDAYENPYVDYKKIIAALKDFDFYRSDPSILRKIVNAIMVCNAVKNKKINQCSAIAIKNAIILNKKRGLYR